MEFAEWGAFLRYEADKSRTMGLPVLLIYHDAYMKTVSLKIDNSIYEKFCWLLAHFSKNEIQILEQSDYLSDDDYLRTIDGMVQSINEARAEPEQQGMTLENLDW